MVGYETIIMDSKRRRVDNKEDMADDGLDNTNGPAKNSGPLNLLEAGPGFQARLDK